MPTSWELGEEPPATAKKIRLLGRTTAGNWLPRASTRRSTRTSCGELFALAAVTRMKPM